MAYLAIKGELTYEKGKELISILELLGGNNKYNNDGTKSSYWYYIDSEGIIHALIQSFVANEFIFLTLEEYLYRYPYIVGDKVIYHGCEAVVTSMEWINNEVCYTVLHKGIIWQTTVFYLQPYKEPMEENTDKALASDLIRQDYSGKILGYKIPNGYEFDCIKDNEIILKPKQPQYPKTYLECAKILGCFGASAHIDGYKGDLLDKLQELLICRDAYWKIAGDWKPDFLNPTKEIRYFFFCTGITIEEGQGLFPTNKVLIFPTEEMRDAFYDNFEELIKECKDFL